ncbi:MAG: thiamine-phosphate kinase [Verrucomicrobiota bacterium]|nr:thiamine-phosphate kinase [Verrucomicrobiota bacterium]
MTETALINKLTAGLLADETVIAGPGDDCAVLEIEGHKLLFKTDAIVEGVHFDSATSPEQIGHKALARPLSDIAAMGGAPSHALITLGINTNIKEDYIEAVYTGLKNCAAQYGVNIVGGETTTLPHFTLSVSLLGKVKNPIMRTGSNIGDAIFVSGELGGSITGHHLNFIPRIVESQWLTDSFNIHAMIDLSDGLASDLRHLLTTLTGAEILTSSLPIRHAARENAQANPSNKTALLAALTDGEDYELLFTVSPEDAVTVLDEWKKQFPDTSLKCIGKIIDQPGIHLRDGNGTKPLTLHGYDHIQKS